MSKEQLIHYSSFLTNVVGFRKDSKIRNPLINLINLVIIDGNSVSHDEKLRIATRSNVKRVVTLHKDS